MEPANIDLNDLDKWLTDGVPHDTFRWLRREAPVFRHPGTATAAGYWAVTRHADVVHISKNPGIFSSFRGGTNIFDLPPEELGVVQSLLINMDPPQHTKYRRLVSRAFTPRIVATLEPHVRALARDIIDRVAERGECDFVTSIAAELPLQVIVEMLGVPREDRHLVFDWSNRLIGFDDPEFQNTLEDGKQAASELWMYAHQLAEKRKQNPEDDLVTALLRGAVDGENLTEMEFDAFFLLLAVAGNETTRNLISGGMLALLAFPDQWQRLRQDPELLPSAVEEMLRWVTPVVHFRRTATQDTRIGAQKIEEGDKVVMFYSSANRDETVFRDADTFDVSRSPNDHLSFGIGEHFCLGANLARLEIRIMFEEILRRLPDIALAGPIRRLRSNLIAGIKTMPVQFTPEKVGRAA